MGSRVSTQFSIVLRWEMVRSALILCLLLAVTVGHFIPARKNVGSIARNYKVSSPHNLVDLEDNQAGKPRDALRTTEITELIEEEENSEDTTKPSEQEEGSGEVRDPSDADEFDEDEFVSSKSEIEYDYDDYEEEGSGRSNEEGPLAPILARVNLETPLGQFLSRINDFKIQIKKEINLLGRNIRLGLAFLNVG